MQISGAQAAILIIGAMVLGLAGVFGTISRSADVVNAQRLTEIAASTAESIATAAASSGSTAPADSYTVTDPRLGQVSVAVSVTGTVVSVSASAKGISRTAQAEAK